MKLRPSGKSGFDRWCARNSLELLLTEIISFVTWEVIAQSSPRYPSWPDNTIPFSITGGIATALILVAIRGLRAQYGRRVTLNLLLLFNAVILIGIAYLVLMDWRSILGETTW